MPLNSDSPPNSPSCSQPEPIPLAIQAEAEAEAEKPSMKPSEMQIIVANNNSDTTPFKLPDDWLVEIRPRPRRLNRPKHFDKYYYEPGTGRKFRSLLSVKRHLSGEDESPPRKRQSSSLEESPPRKRQSNSLEESPPRKKQSNSLVPYRNYDTVRRVVYGGKVLTEDELEEAHQGKLEDIYPETPQSELVSTLPDGWIVEKVPRKCGIKSDTYYIDPATGKRFRSIPEAHRFLKGYRYKPESKTMILKNCASALKSPFPKKKNTLIELFNDTKFDFTNPPEKIKWVYSGDGKDNWSALVEECMIPNYIKEQWSETFLSGMNGLKDHVLQLTM